MTQPDLFDETLDQQFEKWVHSPEGGMAANWFIRLGLQAKKAGLEKYGAKGIAEVLRWQISIEKKSVEIFKINNNYISRLARFAEERAPELKGLFEKRELKT